MCTSPKLVYRVHELFHELFNNCFFFLYMFEVFCLMSVNEMSDDHQFNHSNLSHDFMKKTDSKSFNIRIYSFMKLFLCYGEHIISIFGWRDVVRWQDCQIQYKKNIGLQKSADIRRNCWQLNDKKSFLGKIGRLTFIERKTRYRTGTTLTYIDSWTVWVYYEQKNQNQILFFAHVFLCVCVSGVLCFVMSDSNSIDTWRI